MERNLSNECSSNGSEQSDASSGHVRKVKETWQQFEDFGLAHRLQKEEFNQHFDQNRSERKLMHGDLRLSKEEQRQEDDLAAEYREQVRRDRERQDERLALEIQRKIEMESGMEVNAKRAREREDEMLARRLQEMEMSKESAKASGGSTGNNRPFTHRHASLPGASGPQISSVAAASMPQEFRRAHTVTTPSSDGTASLATNKKAPPPRPPPPRHDSWR